MYSNRQLQLLKKLSDEDELFVYLDSTGSVISNIAGQKRPFLYSLVVKPNSELPPVSLADMISTQHTIPRIELFLSSIKRSAGKELKLKKVETDYSMALIQSCLHTFNNSNVKTYLQTCFSILKTKNVPLDFTVHHICAAHLIKDFSRHLSKYKLKTRSDLRRFALDCFAALQNTTTLQETKEVFSLTCTVLLNSKMSANVTTAIKKLNNQFHSTEVHEDQDSNDFEAEINTEKIMENLTIKASSPFTEIFQNISTDIEKVAENEEVDDNSLFCPEAVECLLDKFMPIVPSWSGVMLNTCLVNTENDSRGHIISRDTNSPVENWFKFVKSDLKIPKYARPYIFATNLRQAIESRLKEQLYPGCRKRKKKTKRAKQNTDCDMVTVEEIWKPKRKKNVHHTASKLKTVSKNTGPTEIPIVMKWGGKIGRTVLANTCTIDNVLTILHIRYVSDETFKTFIDNDESPVSQTLLTVFKLMSEEQFSSAKVIWTDFTGKPLRSSMNLYGDEYDYIVAFLDRQWSSYTVSTCDNPFCEEPRHESQEHRGVVVSIAEPFPDIQDLVNRWLDQNSACADDHPNLDETAFGNERMCSGRRHVKRKVLSFPPIFVVRVYEHCLYDRLSLQQILNKTEVVVQKHLYRLAGLTLHKGDHYTAIVATIHGPMWYDGLIGTLKAIPRDVDTWFPSHVLFVRGN